MMNEAARSDAAYEAACSSWQAKAGSRGLIAESGEDLEDVEVIDPSSLGFGEQGSGDEEDAVDYDEDCAKKQAVNEAHEARVEDKDISRVVSRVASGKKDNTDAMSDLNKALARWAVADYIDSHKFCKASKDGKMEKLDASSACQAYKEVVARCAGTDSAEAARLMQNFKRQHLDASAVRDALEKKGYESCSATNESLDEKVGLEECGFMLEGDDVLHSDDEACSVRVEVTKEDGFAENAFKELIEGKFPVKVEMVSDGDKAAFFSISGRCGDVKDAYACYAGKKSWDEVVDTPDEELFYDWLVFEDDDTFAEAQYREEVAKMLDDGEAEEEQIDEADDREPMSHALDIVGVKASTADLAGQDEVELTVVEKLQKRVDELEKKLLKGSCGPMNEGEDSEELAPGWVRCCKCGAKLNKDTDTYRFTSDGKPICYDCDEEPDEDDKELEEHVKAVLEQEEKVDEGLMGALTGGLIGTGLGAVAGSAMKGSIKDVGDSIANSTDSSK